jgi:CTP synthase
VPGTKAADAYRAAVVSERHRHRWEFNSDYQEQLEACGLVVSGVLAGDSLVEIVELRGHPFMLGTQFHPELQSRPNRPHPLFGAFVQAAVEHARTPATEAVEAVVS